MCSILHYQEDIPLDSRHIGYLLKAINDKLKVNADKDLKNHNLTLSQSRVLAFLNSQGGSATQKEIEDFLEVSHPTVVGIVSRMEQNHHVTTWIDPQNRRNKMVQLTDTAHLIGKDMEQMINSQEAHLIHGLTPEQVEELKRMLMVIYQNL